MKTWRTRKAAPAAAALAVAAGVLPAGCSGGDGSTTQATQSSSAPGPATSTAKVTDKALGKALDKLAFQGAGSPSKAGGPCLASAVRKAGIPEEALAYIVKTDGDDTGAVINGLNKVSKDDAALLASRSLREAFDACVDKAVPPSGNSSPKAQSYKEPTVVSKPVAGKLNLKPVYPVREDQPVNSSIELIKGLVSMFSSYARDEGQKEAYAAAGPCMSTLVYGAGFSQEALHFFAGGARLGAGSIVEHLPSDKDKAIWQSPRFAQGLVDCAATATPTLTPRS
ncbi:hypothetical protein AB0D34_08175 [Streptomyces sp. NPDC048420]|uniref:hypothetical protein n=1 Tax=Streptomyces sp. NPDC048420 TaxID=3155755 RepID=UPI00343985F2